MMTNRDLAERVGGSDDSAAAQAVRRLPGRFRKMPISPAFTTLQQKIRLMS